MNVYDYADKLLDKLSNKPLTIDMITIQNNEDTFDFARNLLQDYGLFPDYEKLNLSKTRKSNELAMKHRLKGNELFKDRKYFSALCAYNESLCHAETNSGDLGLAFANRSAVFLEIEEFGLCQENIKLAKEFGYPRSKFKKLERREKHCYGRIENKSRELNLLQLAQKFNTKYPFIAESLTLRESFEFGRHIVTDKALKTGEIVAIDRPFCGLLLSKCQMKRCINCLRQFKMNIFPCNKCSSGEKTSSS